MTTPVIIQYRNTDELEHGIIPPGSLVITAQRKMAFALAKKARAWARDANTMLRKLLPDWHSTKTILRQRILLSRIIDETASGADSPATVALESSAREMLSSIRTLCEIGVDAASLPDGTEEQDLFRDVYRKFSLSTESGVTDLLTNLQKWLEPEQFKKLLVQRCLTEDGRESDGPQKVFFQGFYYILPLQARLMEAFEGLGIRVYFLNAFDDSCPDQYQVWTGNPRYRQGWEVRTSSGPASAAKPVAPDLICFHDAFAMARFLRTLGKDTRILAPMSKAVKPMLETFVLPSDEKESLLSLPVGQYILHLHELWNQKCRDLVLDSEILRRCLSTGWAGKTYSSQNKALEIYDRIGSYFAGCSDLESWEDRASLLTRAVKQIVPIFDAGQRVSSGRTMSVVQTPLAPAAAFSISPQDVDELCGVIRQMKSDAQYLFDGADSISLDVHFRKIRELLRKKAAKAVLQPEEKAVLSDLQSRLSTTDAPIEGCAPRHLADAVSYILGGSRQEQISDEGDEHVGEVRGIADIEAFSLLDLKAPVLMCCCSEESLPGKEKPFSWPLSENYLEGISDRQSLKGRLDDYLYFIRSSALSGWFLFHLISKFPKLTLSWIETDGEKRVNPSVYLRMTAEKFALKPRKMDALLFDADPGQRSLRRTEDFNLKEAMSRAQRKDGMDSREIEQEASACPAGEWRAFLSYGLTTHPCYSSEFHMRFYLTRLTAVIAKGLRISVSSAAQRVFQLYPAYSSSERQEIVDFAEYFYWHLPDDPEKLRTEGKNVLCRLEPRRSDDSENPAKSRHCIYCPHGAYCYVRANKGDS